MPLSPPSPRLPSPPPPPPSPPPPPPPRGASAKARFLVALNTSAAGHPGVAERWLSRLLQADPDILERADGIAAHPYNIGLGLEENALDELEVALRARRRRCCRSG